MPQSITSAVQKETTTEARLLGAPFLFAGRKILAIMPLYEHRTF